MEIKTENGAHSEDKRDWKEFYFNKKMSSCTSVDLATVVATYIFAVATAVIAIIGIVIAKKDAATGRKIAKAGNKIAAAGNSISELGTDISKQALKIQQVGVEISRAAMELSKLSNKIVASGLYPTLTFRGENTHEKFKLAIVNVSTAPGKISNFKMSRNSAMPSTGIVDDPNAEEMEKFFTSELTDFISAFDEDMRYSEEAIETNTNSAAKSGKMTYWSPFLVGDDTFNGEWLGVGQELTIIEATRPTDTTISDTQWLTLRLRLMRRLRLYDISFNYEGNLPSDVPHVPWAVKRKGSYYKPLIKKFSK